MRALASAAQHWTQHYVGLSADDLTGPQRPSACFELVRHVYRGERGVFLPAHSAGSGWRLISPHEAQAFDLVVFEHGGVTGHVGVMTGDPWTMLHVPDGKASIIERFDNGSFLPRLAGIYRREDVEIQPPILTSLLEGTVGLLGLPFINPETGRQISAPASQSLAELVAYLYPATSDEQRARMRVTVGRHNIPLEHWHEFPAESWTIVRPHAGVMVAVEPLPGAIPWGKVLALVALTAALAAGQFYLAPLLPAAFATTFATAAIATGLSAISLIIQGMLPGEKESKQKQLYAATGWQNRVALFEPVPDPLGKMRTAPPYAALPYISMGTGEDAQLFTWPYVFDPATANADPGNGQVRLSISDFTGVIGAAVVLRIDDLDDDGTTRAAALVAIAGSTSTFTVLVRNPGVAWIRGTVTSIVDASGYSNVVFTATDTFGDVFFSGGDDLIVRFSAPEGGDVGSIYLHGLFLEAVGQGVISDRRFDTTPLEKYDEASGTPVDVEEFLLGPGDAWSSVKYPHIVVPTDPSAMGAKIENGSVPPDWVERVVARDCTAIEVFIRFDAGLFNFEDDGTVENISVYFQWEYAPLGTEDWVTLTPAWTEVRSNSRTPFIRTAIWDVDRGDYKVRHRKTAKDGSWSVDGGQDGYIWFAMQGHRPEAPVVPRKPMTLTAFRIRSTNQLQESIGSYNRIFSRRALDWVSGTSTWTFRQTASPAAAFRYKLQSGALAVPYADAAIDLDALADWSEYCEDNNLEYNSVGADAGRSLFEALGECAVAGRARPRRFNEDWGVVVDGPQLAIMGHVTPRNGWAISASTDRTPEANGFRITFSDETCDYLTKTRMVPFPGFDEDEITKPLEISLPYTDPEAIYREATRLYYLMFERRLSRWAATASWDHMTYGAGTRVLLDDGLLRSRVAALVNEVSGDLVTLDEPVTQLAGHSYQIQFRYLPAAGSETPTSPPAETITRTVRLFVGESRTIELTGSGVLPEVDDLVIFSEVGAGGIDAVVDQIEADENLTAKLSLIAYTPDLDDLIADLDVPVWDGRVGG